MTLIFCPDCRFHKSHQIWQKTESDEWHEYVAWFCHHPRAKDYHKPHRSVGAVMVGFVCWVCRGTWPGVTG